MLAAHQFADLVVRAPALFQCVDPGCSSGFIAKYSLLSHEPPDLDPYCNAPSWMNFAAYNQMSSSIPSQNGPGAWQIIS
jgi:hypothetical protein